MYRKSFVVFYNYYSKRHELINRCQMHVAIRPFYASRRRYVADTHALARHDFRRIGSETPAQVERYVCGRYAA